MIANEAEGMRMKIDTNDFRVRPEETVKLSEWPTNVKSVYKPKKRDALHGLKMAYPKTTAERRQELKAIRKHLL